MNQIILFLLILNFLNTRQVSITENTCNIVDGETGYDANKVGKNEIKIVVPLKHLSNLWRTLNIPLIN